MPRRQAAFRSDDGPRCRELFRRRGSPTEGAAVRAKRKEEPGQEGRKGVRTLKPHPLTPEERAEYAEDFRFLERVRPRTRGDCREGERPCPFISCRYHLYLEVKPDNGNLRINFPDLDVWELEETCALDVAEFGHGVTLQTIGRCLNVTRERVRQIQAKGLRRLEEARALEEFVEED